MSKSELDEEEISEMETFDLDEEDLNNQSVLAYKLARFARTSSMEGLDGDDSMDGECISVDQETQARLEALLEAAGIGKLSTSDGKAFADPEVLRRLTSSVSCALDEAAAALSRMRAETGAQDPQRSLVEACSDGDIGTVRRLLNEGRSVHETTEDGESLLSLACSAGYYELAEVLLSMRANIEDRGSKGECTPLMEAASGGYKDIVELLIAHGADVNATSNTGNTALTFACCGGYAEIVEILIAAGADLEVHNENGHTPLMEAASGGHVDVGAILLKHGAGINTHSNEFKESALTLACYKGHLEMVRFLLEAGADQEHKTDEMHTALMEASMDGHVDVARLLLDSGAQVNMPADSFESPLTLAACGGHVELASLLLVRGANIEEVNDEGYTPLMEASREGHEEMVAILLAHGAKVNVQTEETQETALTLACCGGFLECCKLLVNKGANLELGCSTPLMEAAQEGHLDVVQFLIQQGANVQGQTSNGDTALSYACEHGHTDVADLLLSAGAVLEQESEGGRTPLMKAARAGHLCTVQFLISRGADVNRSTRNNDHTVLSLACFFGHLPVVELLLCQGADPLHKLKDNSTMLLEAAKAGHTAVVQLLLDFPQNFMNTSVPVPSNVQVTPPISDQSTPRVPTQALPMIVPPQEPDKAPCNLQWYSKTSENEKSQHGVQGNYQECQECTHFQPIKPGDVLPNATYDYPSSPILPCPPPNSVAPVPTASTTIQQAANSDPPDGDPNESYEFVADKEMRASMEKFFQCMASGAVGKNRTAESIVEEAQGKLTELEQRIKEAIEKNAQLKSLELKSLQTDQLTKEKVEEMYKTREEQIMKKQKILEELQKVERELQLKTQQQLKKHYEEEKAEHLQSEIENQGTRDELRGKPDGEDSVLMNGGEEVPQRPDTQLDQDIMAIPKEAAASDATDTKKVSSTEGPHPKCTILSRFFEANNLFGDGANILKARNAEPDNSEESTELVLNFVLPSNEQEKGQQEEQQERPSSALENDTPICDHQPCTTPHLVHPTTSKQEADITQLDVATTPVPFGQDDSTHMQVGNEVTAGYQCPSIDCCTESNHDTPLTLACAGGHEDLVELLIERNANIEHRDKKGFTPLILAATAGHVGVVAILLNANADIESQSERTKDTPLSLACSGGRLEVVELLLARGANKEHRNVSDYTPLSLAASGGYVKIIELLLEAGAEINSRTGSKLGISPLMLAAMNGHANAVMLLLERGADINAQIETNRNTALTLACFQGRHEVVSLLVDRKANVEHRAKTGLTPLMEAASGGYAEVGRVLLEKGADVNAAPVPSSRDTALTIAADKGHYRFCELVIAHGAMIDVRNKKGNTPLWLACNGGHLDVAQLLISKEADPNAADNRNITPLMAAFRKGHVKVTRWLVKGVSQFPSDAECMRYIATISDRELLKRCHMCMECIGAAKDRQAQEANKYASQLLQELDMEKVREESRKERAARKREKRRNKRKQKQQLAKSDQDGEEGTENEEKKEENEEVMENVKEKSVTPVVEEMSKVKSEPVTQPVLPTPSRKSPSGVSENEKDTSNEKKKTEAEPSIVKQTTTATSGTASHPSENASLPSATPDKKESRNRESAPSSAKKSAFVSRKASGKQQTGGNAKLRSSTAQQHPAKSVPAVAPSPGKKGQRKEEGWKEVVRKSKRVMVPANLISRVIGRGGCNINAIREVTGAHIDIDKQRKGGQERTVTIRGQPECMRHAHSLITELIREDKTDQDITAIIAKAQADAAAANAAKTVAAAVPTIPKKVDVVEAPLPVKSAWAVPPSMVLKPVPKSTISPVPPSNWKPITTERTKPAVCTVQGNNVIRPTATSHPAISSVRKALFSNPTTTTPVSDISKLMSSITIKESSSGSTAVTPSTGEPPSSVVVSSGSTVTHSGAAAVSFMSKATDKHNSRPVQPVAPMVSSLPVKSTASFPSVLSPAVVTTNHTFVSMPGARHTAQSAHVIPQQRHVNAAISMTNASAFRSPNSSQYSVVPGSQISANPSPSTTSRASLPSAYSPFNNLYTLAGRTIWSGGDSGQATYTAADGPRNDPALISQQLSSSSFSAPVDQPTTPGSNYPNKVVSPTLQASAQVPSAEHSPSAQESISAPVVPRVPSLQPQTKNGQPIANDRSAAVAPVADTTNPQYDRKIWPIGTERAISQRRGTNLQPSSEVDNVGGIWSFSDAPPELESTPNWSSNVIPDTKDPTEVVQDVTPSAGPVSPPQADKHAVTSGPSLKDEDCPPDMPSLSKMYPKDLMESVSGVKMSSVVNNPIQAPLYPQTQNITQPHFSNPSGLGTQPPIGSHLGGGGGMHGYSAVRHGFMPKQPIGAHLANTNQPKSLLFHQQRKFSAPLRDLQHPQPNILDYSQRSDISQLPHISGGAGWQPNVVPVNQHPDMYNKHVSFNNMYKHQNAAPQYGMLGNHNEGLDPSVNREMFFGPNVQPSYQYQAPQQAMYNMPYPNLSGDKGVFGDMKDGPNGPIPNTAYHQPLSDMEQMKPMYRSLPYDARGVDGMVVNSPAEMSENIWDMDERMAYQQMHGHFDSFHPAGQRLNNAGDGEMGLVTGSTGVVNHVFTNENPTNWKW